MSTFGPYPARILDWHDGDTAYLDIDLGFDHLIAGRDWDGHPRLACRVYGINAPELSNPDGSGKAALEYAKQICPPGSLVSVISHGWDKFGGRFDGVINLADGRSFGDLMIAAGKAVAYFG